MLHAYSLFNNSKCTGVINYTIYHQTEIQKGSLTGLITTELSSLNQMMPGKITCLLNIVQHIFIPFLLVCRHENRHQFFLHCCRIMHNLWFKCFLIYHSGFSAFMIIFLHISTQTLHYFSTKHSKF